MNLKKAPQGVIPQGYVVIQAPVPAATKKPAQTKKPARRRVAKTGRMPAELLIFVVAAVLAALAYFGLKKVL